jgi:nuclease S1
MCAVNLDQRTRTAPLIPRATLTDPEKTAQEKRFALRFLVHLVEDLHMPLHVGDNHDRGGNDTQVRFYDRGSNMHRLWDSDMITRAGDSEEFWLNDLAALDTNENRAAWAAGQVEDWATESLLAARAAYLIPGTDKRLKPGQKLGDDYQAVHLPVARERLCQGGVRLVSILNETLGGT